MLPVLPGKLRMNRMGALERQILIHIGILPEVRLDPLTVNEGEGMIGRA